MDAKAQFRRRILLVDGDAAFLQDCSDALCGQGYEVMTARNGFDALHALRGAHPDLLVTELNLPHMSGFELLAVIRKRFPQISVIAVSSDYTPVTVPRAAICDAFIAKSPRFASELIEEAGGLIRQSPLRGSRAKVHVVPVWVPRSATGYIVLTCPECLRSFSVPEPTAIRATESCVFCGTKVRFQMSWAASLATPPEPAARSQELRSRSGGIIARSRKLRKKPSS